MYIHTHTYIIYPFYIINTYICTYDNTHLKYIYDAYIHKDTHVYVWRFIN